jgi:hypothetical protein
VLDADEVTGVDEAVGIDDTTSSEDVPNVSEAIFGDGATKEILLLVEKVPSVLLMRW